MSTIIVSAVSSVDNTTPLFINSGNTLAGSIKIEAANSNIVMNGDIKSNSVSGNATGTLLTNIITYSLAF
jgi:hypothetical protein